MSLQTDNKALFTKQMYGHSQILCELLGCEAATPAPRNVMEKCAVSTRMLAGTSALMEYFSWEKTLETYQELLAIYINRGLLWDERIAEITSELIEKEELLVKAYRGDSSIDLNSVVRPGEVDALRKEIVALQESDFATSEYDLGPQVDARGPSKTPDISESRDRPAVKPPPATPVSGPAANPMKGAVAEFQKAVGELMANLNSDAFNGRKWTSETLKETRRRIHFVDFYVRFIDEMIKLNGIASTQPPFCDLSPLEIALKDSAAEITATGDRTLEIDLIGTNVEIDPRLLIPAGSVLRWLIADVFNRAEVSPVRVMVEAKSNNGAIHWKLSDNGSNFISDSRLDHEDQLAFYPGLKDVRKLLGRLRCVLNVEPYEKRQIRFEFSLPRSKTPESYNVWNQDSNMFGVRSVQLCDLMPVDGAPKGLDSYGEFLIIDNRRVPLIKLDLLFAEAPSGGDMVAVIGSLEKRVAFYVPDAGRLAEGIELERSIPVWQGKAQVVAEVNGKRMALMDADQILAVYLDLTGAVEVGDVSGGVLEDESQAASFSDEQAPPDILNPVVGGEGTAEVLVVEQSNSLRKEFTEILARHHLRAAFATGVEEALGLIQAAPPGLIISEFRMPSMAAKVIVETLNKSGQSIPVLVTTSQSGHTADLLVGKLGAAGHLSKPLNQDDVVKRVNNFLANKAGVV